MMSPTDNLFGETAMNNSKVKFGAPHVVRPATLEGRYISSWKESFETKAKKRHAVKNPGELRARTCDTKSHSRSEALRFIDSAKSPSTMTSDQLGDLVPQGSSPDSRVFHDMALLGLCLETFFLCTILSHPGQSPLLSHTSSSVWS